ncbi:hypothetical protein QQP08_019578 [Theobroma cacao]|nr:hypothetical protein QQP08_019578 [Theobroma cacao]
MAVKLSFKFKHVWRKGLAIAPRLNLSPATQTQAIEEGRKELMEMIRNMPEFSYELSLKDMVDEQHASEEVKGKAVSEDESFCSETEAQTKKQKKKKRKKRKAGPISRSGGMEADSFLIKMFFPSSLSFKKNQRLKIAPRFPLVHPLRDLGSLTKSNGGLKGFSSGGIIKTEMITAAATAVQAGMLTRLLCRLAGYSSFPRKAKPRDRKNSLSERE